MFFLQVEDSATIPLDKLVIVACPNTNNKDVINLY